MNSEKSEYTLIFLFIFRRFSRNFLRAEAFLGKLPGRQMMEPLANEIVDTPRLNPRKIIKLKEPGSFLAQNIMESSLNKTPLPGAGPSAR